VNTVFGFSSCTQCCQPFEGWQHYSKTKYTI